MKFYSHTHNPGRGPEEKMASDQTVPTKATFDLSDPDWIVLWLDSRALEAPSALKVCSKITSDHTIVRSKVNHWSN